jgi:hypothetical protein
MYESDCCYSPIAFRHSRGFAVCDHKCTSMSENISIYTILQINHTRCTESNSNQKKWERWCVSTFHLWVEFPQKLFVFACHFLGTLWRDDRLLLDSRWDWRRNVEDDFVGRHFTRNEETSSTHGQRWREMGSLSDANFLHGTAAHTDDTLAEAFYSFLLSDFVVCGGVRSNAPPWHLDRESNFSVTFSVVPRTPRRFSSQTL